MKRFMKHKWAIAPYPGAPPSECTNGCGCKVTPVGRGGGLAYQLPESKSWHGDEPPCVAEVVPVPDPIPETGLNDLPEYWNDLLPGISIPRLTDDQLRTFVFDVLGGRIYIDRQVSNPADVPTVFFPLLFGALKGYNPDSLKSRIGCIYEYLDQALPRCINGQPCFSSMKILHVEDWKRAHAAMLAEEEHRKSIPI